MRVALIKIGALGDVLRTTALIPGLKRLDPALDLTWITARDALPLVANNPDITELVEVDGDSADGWRHRRYDWVISLDDEPQFCRLATSLLSDRLSGAYEDPHGCIRYTDDLEHWFGMGRLRPAEAGGLARANQLKRENSLSYGEIFYRGLALPPPVERPRLVLPEHHRQWSRRWLQDRGLAGRQRVGINSGAGGRWRFKSWGERQTADLARILATDLHVAVIVMGGPSEAERNARIVSAAATPAVVAAPTDLDLLSFASMIGDCAALVTSDSLALHIGLALRRPVVAFFGPTSDAEIDLFGLGEKVTTPLECRRCYLADCDVRPHCMESIGVGALFDAVRRWLSNS